MARPECQARRCRRPWPATSRRAREVYCRQVARELYPIKRWQKCEIGQSFIGQMLKSHFCRLIFAVWYQLSSARRRPRDMHICAANVDSDETSIPSANVRGVVRRSYKEKVAKLRNRTVIYRTNAEIAFLHPSHQRSSTFNGPPGGGD